jgi:thiamine pyrophosphokinase
MMTDTDIFAPLEYKPEAVIVDNGAFPTHPLPLGWLKGAPFVVCCDGAADTYIARGGKPDMIVGDGDSLSPENAQRYASILHRVAEQETNDQTKAVRLLTNRGVRRAIIVGGTGKREDHTLGNISLLVDYYRNGFFALMATDCGIFIPCSGTVRMRCHQRQQVSVFNFGASHFSSEGLVYPLPELTNWWQGTLNETTGESFTVSAEGYYLLYMEYGE